MNQLDKIKGCLLGGAVGDALGAAVEFMDWSDIKRQFGAGGIQDYASAYSLPCAITDDTQMMLFTAEGLLRAQVRGASKGICHVPSVIHHALLRWYITQGGKPLANVAQNGWLIEQKALWSRRAPGNTCLSSLSSSKTFGDIATNNSKGCGGVMRVAPHAFFPNAFEQAADSAHLTHGHPTGYQASGLFADILQRLFGENASLELAIQESIAAHGSKPGMDETLAIVEKVLKLYQDGIKPSPQGIEDLGGGWIAEEALAIGLWCALMADSFEQGVVWAVNHNGDSDSTGLIAGNLLGMQLGVASIPQRWLDKLELREVIEKVAEDIDWVPRAYEGDGGQYDEQIWQRYPGH